MRGAVLAGALLLAACAGDDGRSLCLRDCATSARKCAVTAPDPRVCDALHADCDARCSQQG